MDKTKYNTTIIRGYETAVGSWSVKLDAEAIEVLHNTKLDGKLVYNKLKPESRKNENSPHGYFQYMTPAQVAAYENRTGDTGGKVSTRGKVQPKKVVPKVAVAVMDDFDF